MLSHHDPTDELSEHIQEQCSYTSHEPNNTDELIQDGYLALTAHFVDEDWILQKRVLNFHHMPPPHGGPILAEKVIDLLRDWAVEKKVFTITLDNASYNDDGVKVISKPVSKIQECVKYIRASESRKLKFAECIVQVSLPCNKRVHQDVPTRWNSTFVMLDSALEYKLAFHQLHVVDRNFSRFYPTEEEWLKVQKFTTLLRPFYDLTTLFLGTNYPTTNLYFHGVWKIQKVITEEVNNLDIEVSEMAKQMKLKFEKYWECYSLVLSFAIILDPRFKMDYVVYAFKKLYPFDYEERAKEVRDNFYLLFEEYENTFDGDLLDGSIAGCSGGDLGNNNDDFAEFESQQHANKRNKSQVDSYLDDTRLLSTQELDVLNFWKENKNRYPILSLMAWDILNIPITTVASESAFSIGGRIVGKYHTSLLPENVEVLLCTRDRLYGVTASEDEEDKERLSIDFAPLVAKLTNLHV
ncbi:zinc finger BED domain-containing protein RICESLEEPER 2-like [Coffea eugenioides]|uniref:zinc finger BED domain-containing protein RICESLEEPER 2-like n=1 Tax=Coffea eugenioides TaxID=49369 RepID=UPI000F609819|nr:zinc finger BED domain-containing protein RICESLEEPER 2-like [Coffea eugenioides]